MKRAARGPVLLVVAAALVVGLVLDRQTRPSKPASAADTTAPIPAAAPASARSSTWYCTGFTAAADTVANGAVVVANAGSRPLKGSIVILPSEGTAKVLPLDIGSASVQVVRLADVAPAPFASAIVELDGGDAIAQVAVTGPVGDTVGHCASGASGRWYFADGVTTKDATETLYLFNPFPDDAVVDLTFGTEEGQVRPGSLTGMSVPGRSTVAVAVNDFVQRRAAVSTAVTTRAGRLVAARIQSFDGTAGRKGVTVGLGASAPAQLWYFPEGRVAEGLVERYQVFNPNKDEARVELALVLDQGAAEPFVITVPPETRVTVTANEEARIPKEVSHSVTVRVLNGVDVVVERTVDAQQSGQPNGVAFTNGSRSTARRWGMAVGQANEAVQEFLILQNPGPEAATASVVLIDGGRRQPLPGLQNVQVPAGGRKAVWVNEAISSDATPMVVEADRPIVVEQDLFATKGFGIAMNVAVPLRD